MSYKAVYLTILTRSKKEFCVFLYARGYIWSIQCLKNSVFSRLADIFDSLIIIGLVPKWLVQLSIPAPCISAGMARKDLAKSITEIRFYANVLWYPLVALLHESRIESLYTRLIIKIEKLHCLQSLLAFLKRCSNLSTAGWQMRRWLMAIKAQSFWNLLGRS